MKRINELKTTTVIEAVVYSLRAASLHNPNDVVRPAAILWTDQDSQWQPIIPLLRTLMPELLTYGSYEPETKTGPAIWLRCVIENTLPEVEIPSESIPIIYLPNVSRQTLRAVQECPYELRPLVELQYRGICWTQKNGKDWTVEAFLVSEEGGLGLDMARDGETKKALRLALEEVAKSPIAKLQSKRLEAEDFNKLLVEDTTKDLLVWLNEPEKTKQSWSSEKWKAFVSQCKTEFYFEPENQGELTGGEHLGAREGRWESVWQRFAESSALYPGIPRLLRKAKPSDLFSQSDSSWPQVNEEQENELRKQLLDLEKANPSQARQIIRNLEANHSPRREWVWAKLGLAPLAQSLFHINRLAEKTENPLGGATPDEMAKLYIEKVWDVDVAAWQALVVVKTAADIQALTAAIRSLYTNWLDDCAAHFQTLIEKYPLPDIHNQPKVETESGHLILFVDALRLDVALLLVDKLRESGFKVNLTTRWAGLPTVTATTKPAVSPLVEKIQGSVSNEDFLPNIADTDQALTTDRFRKQLQEMGYAFLSQEETGDPSSRGWTEFGEFDRLGHLLQSKMAYRIYEQIDLLWERIRSFIEAGWKSIRLVTDHGWLLLPGGLPKVDLPKYLTNCKWARCASIKGSSKVKTPIYPWLWNKNIQVAVAPGISCFGTGNEYAHGGASLQECLIPDILIMPEIGKLSEAVSIKEIRWMGLRCRITVESNLHDLKVEIREEVNKSFKIPIGPKPIDQKGNVSLVVSEDDYKGKPAVIVILDASNNVIIKKSTIIGGED